MKFITIVVLALIAVVSCDPIQISDNNIGDIITVGISAKAEISNNVDQDIVNVIIALLNQNAEVSRSDVPLAKAEVSDLTFGDSPPAQYLEVPTEINLIGDFPPIETLDESEGLFHKKLSTTL